MQFPGMGQKYIFEGEESLDSRSPQIDFLARDTGDFTALERLFFCNMYVVLAKYIKPSISLVRIIKVVRAPPRPLHLQGLLNQHSDL